MQTARVTVLMTPEKKAGLAARAADMGVSTGEYLRLAIDNLPEELSEEEELATLVEELNEAVPKMRESLRRSIAMLEATHKQVAAIRCDARLDR